MVYPNPVNRQRCRFLLRGFLLCLLVATPLAAAPTSFNPTNLISPSQRYGLPNPTQQNKDWIEANQVFLEGKYEKAIQLASQAFNRNPSDDDWALLLAQAQWTQGQTDSALKTLSEAINNSTRNIRLRFLAYEFARQTGQTQRAQDLLSQINSLAGSRIWAYQDAPNLVTLGQAAIALQVDPKIVLDNFFKKAKELSPEHLPTYLHAGLLALQKQDYQLASKQFQDGLQFAPDHPELLHGLARAFYPSDRGQMIQLSEQVLKINPNHLPTLLLQTDHFIDAEEYDAASQNIETVLKTNPQHPEAWAYKAVIAHLQAKYDLEKESRLKALKQWDRNPQVDHLIGKKLSQKYRFKEGSTYQQQSLSFDDSFLPAQIQLSQDFLRLGEETLGWNLAHSVHEADGYDVTAFNLVTLHDKLQKYAVLSNGDFQVRMTTEEAEIYGQQVLTLLQQAKDHLSAKYNFEPHSPTIVEIFPNQNDFGVRTFGMPDNPGYLGVCFGPVITANSPAARPGDSINWQAVLWHEFCHVITLQMTENKMPRWLSEGISVYEEQLANPAWGQTMTPQYRSMILEGEMAPVSDLSSAFLAPKSGLHLQFAYYQSYLVVEYLVQTHGFPALVNILTELRTGTPINEALAKHTDPISTLDKNFATYAKNLAENLAPELSFEKPKEGDFRDEDRLLEQTDKNFYTLIQQAQILLQRHQWEEAKAPLNTLLLHFPNYTEDPNPYLMLAKAHRELGETENQFRVLNELSARNAEATEAYLALMKIESERQNWESVQTQARRYLAVNPLVSPPYRYLAQAALKLEKPLEALQHFQTQLLLSPINPALIHFQIAQLYQQLDQPALAKSHTLKALEEAPRYQEALKLLSSLTPP